MFYDVQADGYSLDDKRQETTENDLPDVLEKFQQRGLANADFSNRTMKTFFVPVEDVRRKNYDLSFNRHKKPVLVNAAFDPPVEILKRMKKLEAEIVADMAELGEML